MDETYIRHFDCPYCSRKIEIFMKEYLGIKNQFQRSVDARKLKTVEDGYSKKMLRKIEISMI